MSDLFNDNEDFDLHQDPSVEDLVGEYYPNIASIRTSDRTSFKRCRRRWGWQSHLKGSLTPIESASPLWFGTGFHYAMEDFHGYKIWPTAEKAFDAYVKATYKQAQTNPNKKLPWDWAELTILGRQMINYYTQEWLIARNPLKTYIHEGIPQVEVHALIELPFKNSAYDKVQYAVTIDRVVEDDDGWLWLLDYKTAKRIQTQFFQTDPQISAYCWAASKLYDKPIRGFIYQQHRKDAVEDPKLLSTGKLSTDKRLKTTHRRYRSALIRVYGDVLKAPSLNVEHLNWLNESEDDSQDKFIRRDYIYRNEHQIESEGTKILMELPEMLDPNLPLYPNPTRECGNLCSFNSACISMDDGSDWEHELQLEFVSKEQDFDSWRKYLELPEVKTDDNSFKSSFS